MNIPSAINAIRSIFFIRVPSWVLGKLTIVRASDAALCTNATKLRHPLRARQDPRNDNLQDDNTLVAAL
jgi:hypothetical protein